MAMAVDAAGGDELACRVDHLLRRTEIVAESGDAAAADSDIGAKEIARRRDLGVADDEIEFRNHQTAPRSYTTVMPAKAGNQGKRRGLWPWIPAFAGMTEQHDI